jgi:hypothetical protein
MTLYVIKAWQEKKSQEWVLCTLVAEVFWKVPAAESGGVGREKEKVLHSVKQSFAFCRPKAQCFKMEGEVIVIGA